MTVSSAGKTFSCTGWKIGWAVGPAALISGTMLGIIPASIAQCHTSRQSIVSYSFAVTPHAYLPYLLLDLSVPAGMITTNQWVQFSVSTPAQQAVAWALERVRACFDLLLSQQFLANANCSTDV